MVLTTGPAGAPDLPNGKGRLFDAPSPAGLLGQPPDAWRFGVALPFVGLPSGKARQRSGRAEGHAKRPPVFPGAALSIQRLAILRGVRRVGAGDRNFQS